MYHQVQKPTYNFQASSQHSNQEYAQTNANLKASIDVGNLEDSRYSKYHKNKAIQTHDSEHESSISEEYY